MRFTVLDITVNIVNVTNIVLNALDYKLRYHNCDFC